MKIDLTNWKTTLLGFLAALINYLLANGAQIPTTRQEWGVALMSALLAALGLAAKDATTHSTSAQVATATAEKKADDKK